MGREQPGSMTSFLREARLAHRRDHSVISHTVRASRWTSPRKRASGTRASPPNLRNEPRQVVTDRCTNPQVSRRSSSSTSTAARRSATSRSFVEQLGTALQQATGAPPLILVAPRRPATEALVLHRGAEWSGRPHPNFPQEFTRGVAPNESRRAPKATTREALIYEALFGAPWLQPQFEKGS
jgi:hypothetical protein